MQRSCTELGHPSNGVQCNKSKVQVASGHPVEPNTNVPDTSLTVHAYYSTVCQTLWGTLTASANRNRKDCYLFVDRYVPALYETPDAGCPTAGHSTTTAMVDDANGGNPAAVVDMGEQYADGGVQGYGWSKKY